MKDLLKKKAIDKEIASSASVDNIIGVRDLGKKIKRNVVVLEEQGAKSTTNDISYDQNRIE